MIYFIIIPGDVRPVMTRIWQSPLQLSGVHQAECVSACMKQPPVFVHLQDILNPFPPPDGLSIAVPSGWRSSL